MKKNAAKSSDDLNSHNFVSKNGISHFSKHISLVFQQAVPFSAVDMFVSGSFVAWLLSYNKRSFYDTSKKDISRFLVPLTMRKLCSFERPIRPADELYNAKRAELHEEDLP
jgi:hypothetical protein